MEEHQRTLASMCRTCSGRLSHYGNIDATTYKAEIGILHNIDICDDDEQVHPKKICKKCRVLFQKIREARGKGTRYNPDIPLLPQFNQHTVVGCELCQLGKKRGRPYRKRRRAVPEHQTVAKQIKSLGEDANAEEEQGSIGATEVEEEHSTTESELQEGDTTDTAAVQQAEETGSAGPREPASASGAGDEPAEPGMSDDTSVRYELFPEQIPATVSSKISVDTDSIASSRFDDQELAQSFACLICTDISPSAVCETVCKHRFCKSCITIWMASASVCPKCKTCLDVDSGDIADLEGEALGKFSNQLVRCSYEFRGCPKLSKLWEIDTHEIECPFRCPQKVERLKRPLVTLDRQYVKQKRLGQVIQFVRSFCDTNSEDVGDVLFFMLRSHLQDTKKDTRRAGQVEAIWKGTYGELDADQCLALRVDKLETKNQYKEQYNFLKLHGCQVLASPTAVDAREKSYVPPAARWTIVGSKHDEHMHHTPARLKRKETSAVANSLGGTHFILVDILRDFCEKIPELPTPNIRGVRWCYVDALAKTLEELDDQIMSGLEANDIDPNDTDLIIRTVVKDGADGMGDVSLTRETGDRFLPEAAFRVSFAVLQCSVDIRGNTVTVFKETSPNSVRVNRPLLEAIADENNPSATAICMAEIEKERAYMVGKVLQVHIPKLGFVRQHSLMFHTSMVDKKFDRKAGGLASASSTYMCTLCEATRESAKSELGTFTVSRTLAGVYHAAEVRRVNIQQQSESVLDQQSKGVASRPVLMSEPKERGIDATHADINLATFFKKLVIREIAAVKTWAKTADLKGIIDHNEKRLDEHLKLTIGINPKLMMPGNYARTIFAPENETAFLELISAPEKREHLRQILRIFRHLRKVYRSNDPMREYPDEVKQYKSKAVEMGKLLLEHFSYASWPNYLHKIIEHVQELIEDDPTGVRSVGAWSGEGSEAGNKIFRKFKDHHARKDTTMHFLRDILWLHWLYSSPTLRSLADKVARENRCTQCLSVGHNRKTCTTQTAINLD